GYIREVLIRSPAIAFAFGINASQLEGRLRRPVRRQSRGDGGTGAVTTPARPGCPATGIDRPYGVPMSCPAALYADLAAICRLVAMEARRADLAGVRRVYPFHRNARPLRLVGNEGGQLGEGPGGHRGVVFGGLAVLGPAAGACGVLDRAPADASEAFQADDAYTLLLGMGDDLVGQLVVRVAHPAPLFALVLADGA